MADFCKCGSIIISDKCTNKNCDFKVAKPKSSSAATKSKKTSSNSKTSARGARRSSKCVTYKLSDFLEKEESSENASGDSSESGDE